MEEIDVEEVCFRINVVAAVPVGLGAADTSYPPSRLASSELFTGGRRWQSP